MTPSFLPGKRTMKLRICTGPMGVLAVKCVFFKLVVLEMSAQKLLGLRCPGLVGQRGPMATNSRA